MSTIADGRPQARRGRRSPAVALALLLALGWPAGAARAQSPDPAPDPALAGAAAATTTTATPSSGGARVGAQGLESLSRADDAVVITVGDVALRRSDVFRMLDLAAPARSAEVMRQMVLSTAAQLDSLREGIDVPLDVLDREIELAIAQQRASFALEVDESMPLEDYLRLRHGMNAEQYRDEVRRMVLGSLLLERAVRLDELRVSSDSLSLILVEEEALAREIMAQLEQGASFAVLAKKHSRHASGESGGELPPIPLDSKVPLLEGRETLQPGQVLGPAPVTTEGRTVWRILRLDQRQVATEQPWAELRERVETELVAHPVQPEELAVFEARAVDRYRVSTPLVKP